MLKRYLVLWAILLTVILPSTTIAQSPSDKDARSILSAFMSYTDSRIESVQDGLETLESTAEVRSGKWDNMKGLLGGYQKRADGLVVWFVLPDGTYYTVDRGLMEVKLRDRSYFKDLMAGSVITGAVVVSKSTGQRSAVIAVPVKDGGKVIGAVGATLFLDKLSEQISSILDLREGLAFFALSPDGLTTLHSKTERHFLDPRELGSESLKKAAEKMLSTDSGEVFYEYDEAEKSAIYLTSPLTGWKFVLISSAAPNYELPEQEGR